MQVNFYRLICAYYCSHVGQWCWWQRGSLKTPPISNPLMTLVRLWYFWLMPFRVVLSEFLPFLLPMRMGLFFLFVPPAWLDKNLSRVVCCTRKNKRYVGNIQTTIMTTPTIITIETDKHLRWTCRPWTLKRNDFDSTLRLCCGCTLFLWPERELSGFDLSKCYFNPSSRAYNSLCSSCFVRIESMMSLRRTFTRIEECRISK